MHDLVNRVAYLQRGCDMLLARLKDVDRLGDQSLSPLADSHVEDANQRWANGTADHIELATQHVEGWYRAVKDILDDQWGADPSP
jgi:hypothetical protein